MGEARTLTREEHRRHHEQMVASYQALLGSVSQIAIAAALIANAAAKADAA